MIYTSITVERKENFAIVQLDGGKVNEINTAMVRDLKHVFTALDQDDSVRGLILSGRPHGFSAGLDIVNIAMGGKVKAEDPVPPVIDASFTTRIPFAKRETLAPFHPSPKASVMSNV